MRRMIQAAVTAGKQGDGTRSKFESTVWQNLQKRDPNATYEPALNLSFTKTCRYKPDFVLGNNIVVEAKGWFKASDRSKMILVRDQNPEFDIRLCFQNPKAKLGGGSTTTVSEWADKHGFKWCHKIIPDSWLTQDAAYEQLDADEQERHDIGAAARAQATADNRAARP